MYHPDSWGNNVHVSQEKESEFRDKWEQIKFLYEILSNRKTKMKYDRHKALHDGFVKL